VPCSWSIGHLGTVHLNRCFVVALGDCNESQQVHPLVTMDSEEKRWRVRVVQEAAQRKVLLRFLGCTEARCPLGPLRWQRAQRNRVQLETSTVSFEGPLVELDGPWEAGAWRTARLEASAGRKATSGQHVLIFVDAAAQELQIVPIASTATLRAGSSNTVSSLVPSLALQQNSGETAAADGAQLPDELAVQSQASREAHEARNALIAAFGSKRQKRARALSLARHVTNENVQAAEAAVQGDATDDDAGDSLNQHVTDVVERGPSDHVRKRDAISREAPPPSLREATTESVRLVPPYNSEATTPETAYPLLGGCLPSRFFSAYKSNATELESLGSDMKYAKSLREQFTSSRKTADTETATSLEQPPASAAAEALPSTTASVGSNPLLQRCTHLYLWILLECYHRWPRQLRVPASREHGLSGDTADVPEPLRWLPSWLGKLLLEIFTQADCTETKRIVEKERMLHHILVLYLHCSGFQDQPVDALAEALRLPPARCATYFKYMGLSVRRVRSAAPNSPSGANRSGLFVSLDRLPLQFPRAVRRQRLP